MDEDKNARSTSHNRKANSGRRKKNRHRAHEMTNGAGNVFVHNMDSIYLMKMCMFKWRFDVKRIFIVNDDIT